MQTPRVSPGRHETSRQANLRALAGIRPFVEGSLCHVKRRGCREPGWQLTYKVKGKTHTLYVPIAMAKEVVEWTKEHKRLKRLVRLVTRDSLAIIRRYVANRRAANRIPASGKT